MKLADSAVNSTMCAAISFLCLFIDDNVRPAKSITFVADSMTVSGTTATTLADRGHFDINIIAKFHTATDANDQY